MANPQHVEVVKKGADAIRQWREGNPTERLDVEGADLSGVYLVDADLSGVDSLQQCRLTAANLTAANLSKANLFRANLTGCTLVKTNLSGANLAEAQLDMAVLLFADCTGANFKQATLGCAFIQFAKFCRADLRGARIEQSLLGMADLSEADLRTASLFSTSCIRTNFRDANLTGCRVYGVSSWDINLDGAIQKDLIVTPENAPEVTVDNLEIAQFIYTLLHNKNISNVIDTITSKVVLILGNFSDKRKPVLDAMRAELRKYNYVPVMFDFSRPNALSYEETITLLARMARFIIADITDAREVRAELALIAQQLPSVPVQPLLKVGGEEWSTFATNFRNRPSILPLHHYGALEELTNDLPAKIIAPAEKKSNALRG